MISIDTILRGLIDQEGGTDRDAVELRSFWRALLSVVTVNEGAGLAGAGLAVAYVADMRIRTIFADHSYGIATAPWRRANLASQPATQMEVRFSAIRQQLTDYIAAATRAREARDGAEKAIAAKLAKLTHILERNKGCISAARLGLKVLAEPLNVKGSE